MVLGCRDPYFIGGGPYSSVLDGGAQTRVYLTVGSHTLVYLMVGPIRYGTWL